MKRTCRVCSKTLADLNPNADLCFAHDQRYPQYEYVPATKVASYVKELTEQEAALFMPTPGTGAFNRIAFIKRLIYPNL